MGLAPSTNVHLRNSFDTDPSPYLGRFVKDSAQGAFDESSTMSLACSSLCRFVASKAGASDTTSF